MPTARPDLSFRFASFFSAPMLAFALGFAALLCQQASADDDAPTLAERAERAFARETLGEFWGSVCVTQRGEVVWSVGMGYADESLDKITPDDTLFDVGSVAKSFTAVAILRLVDEGVTSLDATLGDLFEGVPSDKASITLGQLLSHTSGFPAHFRLERSDTAQGMLVSMWNHDLESAPGESFAYSNANYFIAAAALERLAGEPFEEAIHRLVLSPAGLTHTGLLAPPSARPAQGTPTERRAMQGQRHRGGDTIYQYPWNWGQRGATGVVSTARDLCRWADVLASDNDLLSPASHATLLTPRKDGYALGWRVETNEDGSVAGFSHGGATGGYRAHLVHDTATGTTVAVLSHSGTEVSNIADRVMHAVAPSPPQPTVASFYLKAYTEQVYGVYEIARGLTWQVMPEYTSSTGTDKRPTLIVEDQRLRFWPLIVRMDRDRAGTLVDRLRAAIEAARNDERFHDTPWQPLLLLTIDTRERALNEHRHGSLGDDPRIEAHAEGLDVVLSMTAQGEDQPAVVVRMGVAEAGMLVQSLRRYAD